MSSIEGSCRLQLRSLRVRTCYAEVPAAAGRGRLDLFEIQAESYGQGQSLTKAKTTAESEYSTIWYGVERG